MPWVATKVRKCCLAICEDLEVQVNWWVDSEMVTPWKNNGWNLQPSTIKRKENDLNQTSMIMCKMLIFQGVENHIVIYSWNSNTTRLFF